MKAFGTTCTESTVLDPYKRVHYATGMVLGEDEFRQEQTYFLERDLLHNRALHGYGVVCGLDVSIVDTSNGPEVRVEPGLAVNPRGDVIRVPQAQCARLNEWLAREPSPIDPLATSPHQVTIFLQLCHDECKTDAVPVPSGPCRSLEDSSTPSRVADDFRLMLETQPPLQIEEDTIREFGELLRSIVIDDEGPFISKEQLLAEVRTLAVVGSPDGSPPGSPSIGPSPASPPIGSPAVGSPPIQGLRIPIDQADDYLRDAFRVWVHEVRPRILPGGRNCASGPPQEKCVLLAELTFEVIRLDSVWRVNGDSTDVDVNRQDSPFLLQTRLLQEWLLTAAHWGAGETEPIPPPVAAEDTLTFATVSLHDPDRIRAWLHYPELLDVDPTAVRVELDDAPAVPAAVSQLAGVNVVEITLSEADLSNDRRVMVEFDLGRIQLGSSPPQILADVLDDADFDFLDREGDFARAYLSVSRPMLRRLADVNAPGPNNGDILTFNVATGEWQSGAATLPQHALDDHTDVNAPGPGDGDILTFDIGTLVWQPEANVLDNHTDVVAPSPNEADFLTFRNNRWVNRPLTVPPPPLLEQRLTRIVALSWEHDGFTRPSFDFIPLAGNPSRVDGVVVAFGFQQPNDGGIVIVERGSLDENSFQIYVEEPAPQTFGLLRSRRIDGAAADDTRIVPVDVTDIDPATGLITVAREIPGPEAAAAAFIIGPRIMDQIGNARRIIIVVRGDFILDQTRQRVIDAEHLRAGIQLGSGVVNEGLPTGDRPLGERFGIQGGTFLSWIRRG